MMRGKNTRNKSDSTKTDRSSLSSPSLKLQGEAHLPGEVTNPDEQLYQFVA